MGRLGAFLAMAAAVHLEHVPEKHALGLDPMGGNRFSEKDMRQQVDLEHFPIPLHREMLQQAGALGGFARNRSESKRAPGPEPNKQRYRPRAAA